MLVSSSCLKNLNQTEFKRKLEIKNPEYLEQFESFQDSYESAIKEYLEELYGNEIESITYWGEGAYACGKGVISGPDGDLIVCHGSYVSSTGTHRYRLNFLPKDNGEIEVFRGYY